MRYILFFLFNIPLLFSQNIDINNDYNYDIIRSFILKGDLKTDYSLNIRPLKIDDSISKLSISKYYTIFKNKKENILLKFIGVDYFLEYNTHHPYKNNNGAMIPNRGYQHLLSTGFYFKLGPLSLQLKPEHHFSENKNYDGFWEGHYPIIWSKRYSLWNKTDLPERFGEIRHNNLNLGQSNILLNWKNISLGFSNENIWWGPSIRNSIMLSNNAASFRHLTFHSNKPLKTIIGNFEWQLITGRLENSGFTPPRTDYEYAGSKLYVPKINQNGKTDDWRYFQGYVLSFSPKWIDGLSLGIIRWVQMYSALVKGMYWWMEGKPSYFPVFSNLFRSNDAFENFEAQTDQAAGLFLNWHWKDSKSRIYTEIHYNDSKANFRDLLLDTDHALAVTIGLEKLFKINSNDFIFNWEWTQMEQSASRLVRGAGSWYQHSYVYDGYTNKGETLGSAIGPGSNSQFISLSKINNFSKIGIGFEIIENDNDFYHEAFANANDYRRDWKDFNFHINYKKSFNNFNLSSNLIYIRSLNYQWELDDKAEPYFYPGRDVNNFHLNIKLSYFIN